MSIAILGTGLLGSGFARAALRRGWAVNVWNRTPEKAQLLATDGAKFCTDVNAAIAGVQFVHLVLSDDAAVDSTIERIQKHLEPGVIIIDHTTNSVSGTAERVRNLSKVGLLYQHAPVFMSPQNALESTGVMLISGVKNQYENLLPHLSPMTGKLVYLGEDPSRAAAMKLAGNLMLMSITTGLADMAAFLKAVDVPRVEIENLFEHFNPGASVLPRAKRMLSANFDNPSWELQMARKDAGLILAEAEKQNMHLSSVTNYAAIMDEWIKKGFANSDWTVIGKNSI